MKSHLKNYPLNISQLEDAGNSVLGPCHRLAIRSLGILLEIGDRIADVLIVLQARKHHFVPATVAVGL
jgi:hypothetical protein